MKEFVIQNKVKLIVTTNYTSACKLKTHSAEPVPVLVFDPIRGTKSFPKKFSEKGCVGGELGEFLGKELFKKVGFGKWKFINWSKIHFDEKSCVSFGK